MTTLGQEPLRGEHTTSAAPSGSVGVALDLGNSPVNRQVIAEQPTPMWDTEVDMVVVGAGLGGLVNAIATVDAGGEVMVIDALRPLRGDAARSALRERVAARHGQLLPDTLDLETDEYFAALIEGVSTDAWADASVPRRDARNLSSEEANSRRIAPFVGARLNGWAEQCLPSTYGLLYTSMLNRQSTTMRSSDGESIEVVSVGAVDWVDGHGDDELRQWIADQSRQRDIEVQPATGLQRIVFEDGVIVGVVLDTPEGSLAVRTRAGVTFAPADDGPVSERPVDTVRGDRMHVCLVGRTASRFGRVELLATEPAAARSRCTGSLHQMRDGLHEARQPSLDGWRCGKVHEYPAPSQ